LEPWANLLGVLDQDGAERRGVPKLLRLARRPVRSNVSVSQQGVGPRGPRRAATSRL